MSSKVDFFSQVDMFDDLYEDELEALAKMATERKYPKGSVIAYQRDVASEAFIVRSGRLLSINVDPTGDVQDWRRYMAGDVVGDIWLFAEETHPTTIKAASDTNILVIKSEDFLKFIATSKSTLDRLKLSDAAREAASHNTFTLPSRRYGAVKLLPDEIVRYESRRSIYLLMLRAILPISVGVVVPLLMFMGLNSFGYFERFPLLSWILVAIPLIVCALWFLFQLLDWSNDWFVITNKHLIHYELDLRRFSSSVSKIPVDQIQSVEVEKSNIWATLLDVGIARITTAAQSNSLIFDFIDNPDAVRDTISQMQGRVRQLDAGRYQSTMRESIEGHFNPKPAYETVVHVAAPEEEEEEDDEEALTVMEQIGSFFNGFRRAFTSRIESDGTITYRKHFIVLLGTVRWPLILFAVLALLWLVFNRYTTINSLYLLLPFFGALGYFAWQIEDWRNDTYQLTDQYVIDIDRRPFGFGESRKQAELGNVQNVNADRPNFLATIFNYGFVSIDTAGATAEIQFENVANPNQIQSDIFKQRELYRQRQKKRERQAQRGEYALLLDVYHQANEQGRIPMRTPTVDLEMFSGAQPDQGTGFPDDGDDFYADRLPDEEEEDEEELV